MHLGRAPIVAHQKAVKNFGEEPFFLRPEPPHDPEIDRNQRPVRLHEQIALMHVGVKKPIAHGVAQKGADHMIAERLAVDPGAVDGVEIGHRDCVHPFRCQNARRGPRPVDLRDSKTGIAHARDILGHFRHRRRLQAQIHFQPGPFGERVDDSDGAQAA